MGTSTSSSGPGSRIPFDPPWLDIDENIPDVDKSQPNNEEPSNDNDESDAENTEESFTTNNILNINKNILAPEKRFSSARRNLTKFCRDGDIRYLKSALSSYIKTGMGGSQRITKRMNYTVNAASSIYSLFSNALKGNPDTWYTSLTSGGLTSNEIIDSILKNLSINSGTLEDESSFNSIADALSEFLTAYSGMPEILTEEHIQHLMVLFLANEIYHRVILDIGVSFEKHDPVIALQRCDKMREFITSTVDIKLHNQWQSKASPTPSNIKAIVSSVIHSTFMVFENGEDE